jgi:hypothetical protein
LKSNTGANGKKMKGQKMKSRWGRGLLGEGCEDYLTADGRNHHTLPDSFFCPPFFCHSSTGSRPANSGGGEPAPGEKVFLIGSMTAVYGRS